MAAGVGASDYVICGFAGDPLAKGVAALLNKEVLLIHAGKFNDTASNVRIDIQERSALENKRVYIVAGNSRSLDKTINDTTMEIYLAICAAKQAGAKEINLYLPHLGYARQDKVSLPGEPSAAQDILRMYANAGVRKITVLDIHNIDVFTALGPSTTGINVLAMNTFAARFLEMKNEGGALDDLVVVAPDKGARERARLFQKAMQDVGFTNIGFAYFDKNRDPEVKGKVESMYLRKVEVGGKTLSNGAASEALKGKRVIVVDDIADTCGTLLKAISENIVGKCGAKEAYAAITHGVFSGEALDKICGTVELTKILVTDSIPLREACPEKLEIVSCARVFAEALRG